MTDFIALKDALLLPANTSVKQPIHVCVLQKGLVTTYKDKKTVCEVIIADTGEAVRAFIYDDHLLQMFKTGTTLLISDFIVKPGFIVITSKTDVFGSAPIAVPDTIKEKAANLMGRIMTVTEAATSPKKTLIKSVEGIIVKASPTQIKRKTTTQEELAFKRARLRDETGTVEVCLWRDLAHTKIEKGDVIKCLNFEVTDCLDATNKATPAICNKSSSSVVELLPHSDKYTDLLDLPQDLLEDDSHDIPPSTITGFGPINVYPSCPNEGCYRKKVYNFKCPKCNVTYSDKTIQQSVNGTLKTSNTTLIYFTQQAEDLAAQLSIESKITDEDFLSKLIEKLPIQARIQTRDNKVTKIKVLP